MPWCPKCRLEYREDVTVCYDCGTTLVAEIEEETTALAAISKEEKANKLLEFLKYEGIESVTSEYNQEANHWVIEVSKDSYKRANKLFLAFRETETEQEKVTEEAPTATEPEAAITFVKKETQYNDLVSTTYTFLLFGILGLAFLILNLVGILDFVQSILMYVVMGIMFLAFIYVGITSWSKSKTVKEEIGTENDLTSQINSWMKENITQAYLNEFQDDSQSPELNYFNITEQIKTLVSEQFNNPEEAYLEHLVEEFYNTEIDHI